MATYQVTLKNKEEGIDKTIEVSEDTYVLDAAEEEGLELPFSCRQGVCSTCTGKLVEGELDQSEQQFFPEAPTEEGFVLTCIGKPSSDCTIITHQQENVL